MIGGTFSGVTVRGLSGTAASDTAAPSFLIESYHPCHSMVPPETEMLLLMWMSLLHMHMIC